MKLENVKKCKQYRTIKRYLNSYLIENGIATPIFQDKVETYLELWVNKFLVGEEMSNIVVGVDDPSGNSESILRISKELCRIDTQMARILKDLGIDVKSVKVEVEDEL